MSNKGPPFEREACKKLSLWWTKGESDWVFWRSAGSGGHATRRGKVGRRTKGHCGDICAVDPVGEPLTRLITTEIKRGHPRANAIDLLDKKYSPNERTIWGFLEQVWAAQKRAGTPYWWLIHRRDNAQTVLWMPVQMSTRVNVKRPFIYVRTDHVTMTGCLFDRFLETTNPNKFIAELS